MVFSAAMKHFLTWLLTTPATDGEPYKQDLADFTSILEIVQETYQETDLIDVAKGIRYLLSTDKPARLTAVNSTVDAPDISRELLTKYSQMAQQAYFPVWTLGQEFGTIVYERQKPSFNFPAVRVFHVNSTNAVLLIQGTTTFADALTNVNADVDFNTKYGHVNKGLMASAHNVVKEVRHTLHPYDNIAVVGHSLGAGVATYATLLLQDQGKNASGYSFGPPPTLQEHISTNVTNIYTIIHRNDIVPRLSLQSVLDVLDRMAQRGNYSRKESNKTLYCAGNCILKVGNDLEELKPGDPRRYPEIIVSLEMISDHAALKHIVKPKKTALRKTQSPKRLRSHSTTLNEQVQHEKRRSQRNTEAEGAMRSLLTNNATSSTVARYLCVAITIIWCYV